MHEEKESKTETINGRGDPLPWMQSWNYTPSTIAQYEELLACPFPCARAVMGDLLEKMAEEAEQFKDAEKLFKSRELHDDPFSDYNWGEAVIVNAQGDTNTWLQLWNYEPCSLQEFSELTDCPFPTALAVLGDELAYVEEKAEVIRKEVVKIYNVFKENAGGDKCGKQASDEVAQWMFSWNCFPNSLEDYQEMLRSPFPTIQTIFGKEYAEIVERVRLWNCLRTRKKEEIFNRDWQRLHGPLPGVREFIARIVERDHYRGVNTACGG